MTEHFIPGTIPSAMCHWHADGALRLPAEYAEWAAVSEVRPAGDVPAVTRAARMTVSRAVLTISSPQDGDRYRMPPGVDARFATIALRASGVEPAARVRWYVDGVRVGGGRWAPAPGRHEIRAESGAESAVATITVEDR